MANRNEATAEFDKIVEAIEGLTDVEWTRLRKIAGSFLYGTSFEDGQELVNEAIYRTLDGKRNWPPNVNFVKFLSNAMKSIADGERNLSYKTEEVLSSDLLPKNDIEYNYDLIDNFGSESFSPESIIISEEQRKLAESDLKIISDYFKSNESAQWILMGIEDELSASDIIEMSGMTKTQYESARKSLLRGLDRLFPNRREKKWAA